MATGPFGWLGSLARVLVEPFDVLVDLRQRDLAPEPGQLEHRLITFANREQPLPRRQPPEVLDPLGTPSVVAFGNCGATPVAARAPARRRRNSAAIR